ncbi:DapH/DapD/GlmU-related protein [Levilactobacillus humaensis]|uniref:DapH/DapD/GlmU-related protein n=1 Tax=Levilactobacillus humaensis TaxID=2950375 RepID=UPI0021C2D575|nr:DapH/DapD/GlmU-related protein [Levilactobacillus humaensis]
MTIFENLRNGQVYDTRESTYRKEVHAEIDRSDDIQFQINSINPRHKEKLVALENELLYGQMVDGTYFTPPMHIDAGSRVFLGKDVYANHDLTLMSVGTITIEDGVMMGPGVGLFTVNHQPKHLHTIMTKEIHIKKNAWIGARVNILPGVTIGENSIIGAGAVVSHDIPDNSVAVGIPAKVIKTLE